MKVIARKTIDSFNRKHPDAKSSIESWYQEALAAYWKNTMDIKNRYAAASILGENYVIFNIKGNSYRLVTKVAYKRQTVFIKWIGTHAEYSKKKFP
ncbi:MAG: type II toxin-antitoxin system HigB family toxin [Spirochaetia bacterium]|jgi:mRNA interferase HigB|nr:type II toxin-antitoxin system HigB family toxin [Spirochaetia bacterium]